ncbi:MAG: DUF2393 family protein [Terracidiphilus sp.]
MSLAAKPFDSSPTEERNWVPWVAAIVVVLSVAAGIVLVLERQSEHRKEATASAPISAPLDSYAPSLPITDLALSESSNLAGSRIIYLDGHLTNRGSRTVTAVTVQVLFRDFAHQVTQNETLPLMLIRTRQPYVDIEPVSAAPITPGSGRDFRLIFDTVSPDWNGAYPEIRLLHIETRAFHAD